MKKLTNSELQRALDVAGHKIVNLEEVDKTKRKELTMVLKSTERVISGHTRGEAHIYSWVEIAAEIGKLMKLREIEVEDNIIHDLEQKNHDSQETINAFARKLEKEGKMTFIDRISR